MHTSKQQHRRHIARRRAPRPLALTMTVLLLTTACGASITQPGGESVQVEVVDPTASADQAPEAVPDAAAADGTGTGDAPSDQAPAATEAGADSSGALATVGNEREAIDWAVATATAETALSEAILNNESTEAPALAYLAKRDPLIYTGDPVTTWPAAVDCLSQQLDQGAFALANPGDDSISMALTVSSTEVKPVGEGLWAVAVDIVLHMNLDGRVVTPEGRTGYLISERGTVYRLGGESPDEGCSTFGDLAESGEPILTEYSQRLQELVEGDGS